MSENQTDTPIVTATEGKYARQHWALEQAEMIVGRDDTCDIIIPERQISRQHIRITKESSQFFIEDLESRNGTWLNDQRLNGKSELNDGDEINLALAIKLQFIGSGATAPLPFELPDNIGGKLRIDTESRRVFIEDEELQPPLSLPQYRLIELLYNNSGSICTRDEVVQAVWPDVMGEGVSEQAIDALVRRLRDRLAETDPETQYIVTVRGHGFRLDNPQDT